MGSGPSSNAQQIAAAPVPAPSPPVTMDNASVVQAEQDVARQNLMKKSVRSTILAGNTGGFNPLVSNPANQPATTGFKSKLG